MNKATENILIIGGIGLVVYLILTQKKAATAQPTVYVSPTQPISQGVYNTGLSTQSLISQAIPDVLQAVDTTWLQ